MKRLILLLTLCLLCTFAAPFTAHAFNAFGSADCKDPTASTAVCLDCSDPANANAAVCVDQAKAAGDPSGDPLSGPNGVIAKATNIVSIIAGIGAIIIMIVAGLNFITSDGDSNKVSSAKSTLKYAIIGIAVIVLARTIILYVVGRL